MSEPSRPREAVEEQPYVDDRVSKLWVALIALVFAAIVAYGLVFGKAGFLASSPTAGPSPAASPTAPASPIQTTGPTPAPNPTAPASPSPAVSASPG